MQPSGKRNLRPHMPDFSRNVMDCNETVTTTAIKNPDL